MAHPSFDPQRGEGEDTGGRVRVQFPRMFRADLLACFQLFDPVRSQRYDQQSSPKQ